MGLGGDLFKVEVIGKLHVLGVDPENLQSSNSIGDSDVDFTVKPWIQIFSKQDRLILVC